MRKQAFSRGGCVMGPGEVPEAAKIAWKPKKDTYEELEDEICVLCCSVITDHGHNPNPLSNFGKCCINCNVKVMQARLDSL